MELLEQHLAHFLGAEGEPWEKARAAQESPDPTSRPALPQGAVQPWTSHWASLDHNFPMEKWRNWTRSVLFQQSLPKSGARWQGWRAGGRAASLLPALQPGGYSSTRIAGQWAPGLKAVWNPSQYIILKGLSRLWCSEWGNWRLNRQCTGRQNQSRGSRWSAGGRWPLPVFGLKHNHLIPQ